MTAGKGFPPDCEAGQDALGVSFGRPHHGWMRVGLRAGASYLDLDASHVPYDSIGGLADRLLAFLADGSPGAVRFCCEPEEYELRVEGVAPIGARLSVERWPDRRRGERRGEVELTWEGTAQNLAVTFWRALHRLGADHFASGRSEHWAWEFPLKAVEQLGRAAECAAPFAGKGSEGLPPTRR